VQDTQDLSVDNISLYNIRIIQNSPDWIQDFTIEAFDKYSLDIEGGIKYLLVDEQYYVQKDKVMQYKRTIRQPVSMSGVEESSKFSIEFNPYFNEIQINKILVRRNGQIIDKINSADMQVLRREYNAETNILSGDRTLSIILDDIKINDVIEFVYTVTSHNEISVKFYNKQLLLEYGVPIYQIHLAIILTRGIKFKYKSFYEKCKLEKQSRVDENIYSLCRINVPAKKIKKYLPYWYYQISTLQVAINTSWQAVASYMAKYYEIVQINDDKLIKLINEIKKANQVSEEIVLQLLKLINTNIRYLSNFKETGLVKPSDPHATIKRGYGDCKDIVYLFINMLAAVGIKSFPVLVHSRYGKGLCDMLPSPSVFDHVIILIIVNGEKYFIDPIVRQDVELLKYLYLPDYGYGLVCKEDSEKLVQIKNRLASPNNISVKDEYHMISWEQNEVVFKSVVTMQGEHALSLIQYMENNSEEKFFGSIQEFYTQFMRINKVVDNKLNITDSKTNKISYTVEYRISLKVLVKENKKYTVEVVPISILEKMYRKLPAEIDYDFYYGPNVKIEYSIDIIDPKINFTGGNELEVSNNVFRLVKVTKGRKGGFLFNYTFEKFKEVVPSESYRKFFFEYQRALSILPASVFQYKGFRFKGFTLSRSTIKFLIYLVIVSILIIIGQYHF